MTSRNVKHHFPLDLFTDLDQIVGVSKIKLGEYGSCLKKFKHRVYYQEQIFVADSNSIQSPIKKNPAHSEEVKGQIRPEAR